MSDDEKTKALRTKLESECARVESINREILQSDRDRDRETRIKAQDERLKKLEQERNASREAHRNLLLAHAQDQAAWLAQIARITAERDALIAKYEPDKLPKPATPGDARNPNA